MKTYFLILCFFSLFIFSGCKRFKEGPIFSFHTADQRLDGNWKVISFTADGVDSMSYIYRNHLDDKWYFSKDYGGGSYPYVAIHYKDSTVYDADRTTLSLLPVDNTIYLGSAKRSKSYWICEREWKILRLKENDMKWKTKDNGIEYLIHFKPYN